mmetsp:Transcript_6486/g.19611  ORF Transcript_6486/g.19611 Transcript_6486/m.19611 type:complete len:135 (+) Transcript_6486:3750-4154(+)
MSSLSPSHKWCTQEWQESQLIIIEASSESLSYTREQMPQTRSSKPAGAHAGHHTPSSLHPLLPVVFPHPSQHRQSGQITTPLPELSPAGGDLRCIALSHRAHRDVPTGRFTGTSAPPVVDGSFKRRQRGQLQLQ